MREAGSGSRAPASPEFTVETITSVRDAARLRDEWKALAATYAPGNPFADPDWQLTWASHFVPADELHIVALRDAAGLCAVAPFYRRRLAYGPLRVARCLQLLGSVEHVVLSERPQIVTRTTNRRRALRRILEVVGGGPDWDWIEVSLAADQGWFEPQWIDAGAFVVHKTSRPAVTMPLPGSVDDLRSALKRNLRESLRRARNRLNRTGRAWDVETVSEPGAFDAAVTSMFALHGARSAMAGKLKHADMFGAPDDRAFVRDVLTRRAADGAAEAIFLRVDGRRVAGLMTLLTPTAVYFSFSGVDPEWWSFSAVTLLQWEALTRAIAAGRTRAELSVGVDVAKLRWSEAVEAHPEFVVVSRRRRSSLAFRAYTLAATASRIGREHDSHARVGTET